MVYLRGGVFAAHKPLYRKNRILRVRDRLPLCYLPDKSFSFIGDRYYRRGGPAALLVRYYYRLSSLDHRNAGIGRPEVYSDCLSHLILPPLCSLLFQYIIISARLRHSGLSSSSAFFGLVETATREGRKTFSL